MAEKKVAFITGVARGQGRAHAVKLASKGMNIVGLDICAGSSRSASTTSAGWTCCWPTPGIIRLSPDGDRDEVWTDIIDVNLTGVWRTIEVVLPAIRAGGRGGSVAITSSSAGSRAWPATRQAPRRTPRPSAAWSA